MSFVDQCGRRVKSQVLALLARDDWQQRLDPLLAHPAKLVCPLFSSLLNPDPLVRWHGVSAFGVVVPALAETKMDRARVVMRRFIWNLNEESGGIGWGCPEAMAEVLATHEQLGEEFHKVFLSYIHHSEGPDNYIDHEPLRAGAFWGVARLAQARPDLAGSAVPDLKRALQSETHPQILGFVCLALGLVGAGGAGEAINRYRGVPDRLEIYWDGELHKTTLGAMARWTMELLDTAATPSSARILRS